MQVNWLSLNLSKSKNHKTLFSAAGIEVFYGESQDTFTPQVIESTNVKDAYDYLQMKNIQSVAKAVFCEGCEINSSCLPFIEALAYKGYAYFWRFDDLLWFLKFAMRLIYNPNDIVDLMHAVERGNHSANVAQLCSYVGEACGLTDFPWEDALYHDIGKIAIPQSLLFTPRYFTETEKKFIQLHVVHGETLIKALNLDGVKSLFALYHHEKYDSSGYVKGLKGADIPKPVKILTLCDVYEALSSHRPYRSALDKDIIFSFFQSKSGEWFDPELVTIFSNIFIRKQQSEENLEERYRI
jgi:HD-GYP domain-containing protein (c-di-GMP phosphodiesterase class II)